MQLMLRCRNVVNDLKLGRPVQAEFYDSVTIFFSDISGFAEFTVSSTPSQVVELLNGVYSAMDDVIHAHKVYKVRACTKTTSHSASEKLV